MSQREFLQNLGKSSRETPTRRETRDFPLRILQKLTLREMKREQNYLFIIMEKT